MYIAPPIPYRPTNKQDFCNSPHSNQRDSSGGKSGGVGILYSPIIVHYLRSWCLVLYIGIVAFMNLFGQAAVTVAWSRLTHHSPRRRTGTFWNYDFTNCACYELQISVLTSVRTLVDTMSVSIKWFSERGHCSTDWAYATLPLMLPSSVSIRNLVLINTTVERKALFLCSFYGMILWLLVSKCMFAATLRKRNLTTTNFLLLCCVVSHVWGFK